MSLLKELLLMEAPKPVKTRTADPKLDDMFNDEFHSPSAAPSATPASKARQAGGLRAAIAARAAAGGGTAPRINHDLLNDLDDEGDEDFTSGERPEPEPETPGTELANQSQEVRAAGKANADWLTVEQLPGYMQTGIRRMGRIVFKPLTKTNMQDISVLANLGGHGPSTKMEINAVAHFAQKNAHETRDLAMTFGDMIPGYEPEAKLYVCRKDTYLVVQDEMGQYIYSWETKDTKDAFLKSIEGGSTNELE